MKQISLLLLMVFTVGATAQTSVAPGKSATYQIPPQYLHPSIVKQKRRLDPVEKLNFGLTGLTRFLSQKPAPDIHAVNYFLDQQVEKYFDFGFMAKKSAGAWYGRLNVQQREHVVREMRGMFLGAMANRLMSYEKRNIRFGQAKYYRGGNMAMVPLYLLSDGARPLRIDFRMHYGRKGWRVYDIAANGMSAIVHYRQTLLRKYR